MIKNIKTLQWLGDTDGCLRLIDQRKLPTECVCIDCQMTEDLFSAIKTLAVRGAPAIGVAAAYGICLAAKQIQNNTALSNAVELINKQADYLASSRPTAVNLFWATDRMKSCAVKFVAGNPKTTVKHLKNALLAEAQKIEAEDIEMCRQIGTNGEPLIPGSGAILTHCNAGALATAGMGTALAPLFEAHRIGKRLEVYVDETRPLLQGARLTAWELMQAGIDATLICDNMAGELMRQGKIGAVIVGADRIAANGDTANKIGTYSLSVLAKAHSVPFYIAAPSSTFDLKISAGSEIPIEQRNGDEVRGFGGMQAAPAEIAVYNPAFDITPAQNISAIITEKGIIKPVGRQTITAILTQT